MKGVFAWPRMPALSASKMASSITMSISALGIENSEGMGLAKKSPDWISRSLLESGGISELFPLIVYRRHTDDSSSLFLVFDNKWTS